MQRTLAKKLCYKRKWEALASDDGFANVQSKSKSLEHVIKKHRHIDSLYGRMRFPNPSMFLDLAKGLAL